MSEDAYMTVRQSSEGMYREKGSKFIASIHAVTSVHEVEQCLDTLRKEHPKARHYCYAWEIGFDGNEFRMNDDGEPSGTAGRPIYTQIKGARLTNVLIVVIRYFGGTELGASGLMHAYKTAAKDVVDGAKIIKKYRQKTFELKIPYEYFGSTMDLLKSRNARILKEEFRDKPRLLISLPRSSGKQIIAAILEEVYGAPDLSWEEIPKRTDAETKVVENLENGASE